MEIRCDDYDKIFLHKTYTMKNVERISQNALREGEGNMKNKK